MLKLFYCCSEEDQEGKEKEIINVYFLLTMLKLSFFCFQGQLLRLLCSLNLYSWLLLFLIQSGLPHKVKGSVMSWVLAGVTREGCVSARLHLPFKW